MNAKQLAKLGFTKGEAMDLARQACVAGAGTGLKKSALRRILRELRGDPSRFKNDPIFGALAIYMAANEAPAGRFIPRTEAAKYHRWGDNLDSGSVEQMERACLLPVAAAGALLPDAHMGYGLPIGGVLAVSDAVIPYAVGVDIACRMKLTVLDMPVAALADRREALIRALENETSFGVGAVFKNRRRHDVLDSDWSVSPVTRDLKDKAWSQLGTSGSGNHFVEYGQLEIQSDALSIAPGNYLALLSHSGSRGTGARVCEYYSKLAMRLRPDLPKELRHLAWLDLKSPEGREYWLAMQLMGRYAAANHELIHSRIARALGVEVIMDIENHHNFAWKETHGSKEVIVHRKGATPAHKGVLGVIPGSMATPGYVVSGLGNELSINSASHGAGRLMSRKKAKQQFNWSDALPLLKKKQVELLSAGLDEVPMAYKDIGEVMAAQQDLVEILASFHPRIVKMAPAGEPPED